MAPWPEGICCCSVFVSAVLLNVTPLLSIMGSHMASITRFVLHSHSGAKRGGFKRSGAQVSVHGCLH